MFEYSSQVRVRIADIIIATISSEAELKLGIEGAKNKFIVHEGDPDFVIKAAWTHLTNDLTGKKLFDSGSTWQLYQDDGSYIFRLTPLAYGSHPCKLASFSRDFSCGEVCLHRPFFKPDQSVDPLGYPLDELLTVNLLAKGRGTEIHACGVVDSLGRGHLFVGQSGAGKSTIAKLWQDEPDTAILSDDRIILRKMQKQTIIHNKKSKRLATPCHAELDSASLDDGCFETLKRPMKRVQGMVQGDITDYGQIWMYGTPWHGEAGLASPEKAPLSGIYFLAHGQKNEMMQQGKVEALSRLFACSFLPFYSHEALDFTLGFFEEVVKSVPCYELRFVPDKGVVGFIKEFKD